MKPSTLWPIAVGGVLFVTVAANVVMLVLAGDPHASAVEPDYYAKALAFDSTRAEEVRSAALSWTAAATVERNKGVRVRLLDRAGAPVDGASVDVVAIHNLAPDHRPEATLHGEGDGWYAATMPLPQAGSWELRLRAVRGADRFEADLREEAR
jgi:nitrogen fixation protein FixH